MGYWKCSRHYRLAISADHSTKQPHIFQWRNTFKCLNLWYVTWAKHHHAHAMGRTLSTSKEYQLHMVYIHKTRTLSILYPNGTRSSADFDCRVEGCVAFNHFVFVFLDQTISFETIGNDLMLSSDSKLLFQPMLTNFYDAIWRHQGSMGEARWQFRQITECFFIHHDDVIKWKHFPRYWPFVRGIHRSPVNSPHKGQWRGALMFSLICVWINGWENNRELGWWFETLSRPLWRHCNASPYGKCDRTDWSKHDSELIQSYPIT